MIISYFNKNKIIKPKKSIRFKKSAKNGEQDAARFHETKNQAYTLFQKTKTKLLKKTREIYCLHEQLRHFKHDARQPLSVVGLIAHDLEHCLEYDELDIETIAQNAQSLHNQVQRLDCMLDSIVQQNTQKTQKIQMDSIVQQYANDFADSLSVALDESVSLFGQPELIECLFYTFFEMFGQISTQISIEANGAHFTCECTPNLPNKELQTLMDAHNRMAHKQGIETYFTLTTNANKGFLAFSQPAHTKLAILAQKC